MTLEELQRDWKNYVLEYDDKRFKLRILEQWYSECKFVELRGSKKKALSFRLRYDDGSWYHEFDILRCDGKGNCYLYAFYARNINKYHWKKIGRFVRLS